MPQGQQADMQVAAMGGVERAAQNPDPPPAMGRFASQGRTWPLPRTRYL